MVIDQEPTPSTIQEVLYGGRLGQRTGLRQSWERPCRPLGQGFLSGACKTPPPNYGRNVISIFGYAFFLKREDRSMEFIGFPK